VYEDDGVSADAMAAQKYELLTVTANRNRGGAAIRISSNGGSFDGKPQQRRVELQVYGLPGTRKVTIADAVNSSWQNNNGVVRVQVPGWQQGSLQVRMW
jgi:hypothetical protein